MSFRMQMTHKLVDPARANVQQDSNITTSIFDSTTFSTTQDVDNNTHATSNTTFSQKTPRFSGPAIRVVNSSSDDFM